MNRWLLITRFPKVALVAVVLVGSTALFGLWWWLRHREQPQAGAPAPVVQSGSPAAAPDTRAERVAGSIDRLVVADGDLIDIDTGDIIFKSWLKGDRPEIISYQAEERKIVGRFERGFQRYELDGTKEKALTAASGAIFSKDLKRAIYAKGRDLWMVDVDWTAFEFSGERQVTRIGSIAENSLLSAVRLGTDKFLLYAIGNNLVRIDLATGEVTPTKFVGGDLRVGRSPTGERACVELNGDVGVYDLDSDAFIFTTLAPRSVVKDHLWTDANTAYFLVNRTKIYRYDGQAVAEWMELPQPCDKLEHPSPGGTHFFASSRKGLLLVNVADKAASIFEEYGQHMHWADETTMLISRDVPDSAMRGTWTVDVRGNTNRLLPIPYQVGRDGSAAIVTLPADGTTVFCAEQGLFRCGADFRKASEIANGRQGIRALKNIVRL